MNEEVGEVELMIKVLGKYYTLESAEKMQKMFAQAIESHRLTQERLRVQPEAKENAE